MIGIHDLKHVYEIKGENAVAIVPRTGDIDKFVGLGIENPHKVTIRV